MTYWGRFYRTEMIPLLRRINTYLMRWARKKYKRLGGFKRLKAWWTRVTQRAPDPVRALGLDPPLPPDWMVRAE
jgi:RNA-directed DNA polymerase